jgi:hypothetical protein
MKTIKSTLLMTFILCLTFNLSQAQNKLYQVHVDYVNPSKVQEYEKIAKEFAEACKTHNPQTSWITTSTSDNRYMYVSEMENFAELDKNPFSDMAKAMGDSFGAIFNRFNTCYDKHGDYVLVLDESLTYMPDGITQTPEGENYRKFYFLYYTPENGAALREALKGVKELFASKDSKEYYRIYRTGFGVTDSYYMVAIAAKDEVDSATRGKANDELLGEGAKDIFGKVMNSISKFEEVSAWMRPDLYYSPKK